MQVAGSEWKLVEEGKSQDVQDQGPHFTTYEDILNTKRGKSNQQASTASSSTSAAAAASMEDELYRHVGCMKLFSAR